MPEVPARVSDRWSVVAGLRCWAAGHAADEAAVELLVGLGARFVTARCLWVRPCPRNGWYWVDADQLGNCSGRLTPDQQRVLALVVTLLGGEPSTQLSLSACPVEPIRAAA